MTLPEITQKLLDIAGLMTDLSGEIPEGDAGKALESFIDEMNDNMEVKLDAYRFQMKQLQAEAAFYEQEADLLIARQKACLSAYERMKTRLFTFFKDMSLEKIKTRKGSTIWIQPNNKSVVCPEDWRTDPKKAPERFVRVKYELDLKAIEVALKSGEKLSGCALESRGDHLRMT